MFGYIEGTSEFTSVKPLPMELFLQMDNCVKDNKNCHLFAFLSLLITTKVFKKM